MSKRDIFCVRFWSEEPEDCIHLIFERKDLLRIVNLCRTIRNKKDSIKMTFHKWDTIAIYGMLPLFFSSYALDAYMHYRGIPEGTDVWVFLEDRDVCYEEIRRITYVCTKTELDNLISRWFIEMLTPNDLSLGIYDYYKVLTSSNNLIIGGTAISPASLDLICQEFAPQKEKLKAVLKKFDSEISFLMISVDGIDSLSDAKNLVANTIGSFESEKIDFGIGDIYQTNVTLFFLGALGFFKEGDYVFNKEDLEKLIIF